ncbi:pyridoxamine 5'-phosphate oxidase family protein [Isoptericola croceus]|uniref:pyridoxamine 5'-phosphate oxidase family protein n=1 Tax=Isoptericola croceus TaxID=3031406 RepID=UPI0023F6AA9E|nr:pyridoxamine 5'-phosphate oxidase family protein [Isoptericola croceus]
MTPLLPGLAQVGQDEVMPHASTPGPRPREQRIADTLAMLTSPARDAWVASSSDDGAAQPYLIPLSLAWLQERVVLALPESSRTARNIAGISSTRLALGHTRDVVLVDAVLEQTVPMVDAPPALAQGYAAQADWDPREDPDGYVYLVLHPQQIQAWREVDELRGRTLMRDGAWVS